MKIILSTSLALALTSALSAANWPQWRGPHFNGSTTETELPDKWSKTENIRWHAKLPGSGAATPIVWGNKVFISSTDPENGTLRAMCFDRANGNLLWSDSSSQGLRQDNRSNYASPSPATDGKIVVFFYGNGDLIGYSLTGDKIWQRNIQKDEGEFAFLWTFSSSPLLYDGKLYLQVLQRDTAVSGRGFRDRVNDSYLLAMDPQTGKTLWKHIRPSKARSESREAFTTPVPFVHQGKKSILVIGGDALTAHDTESGKEQWRWGTWNPRRIGHWRHVPSPVAGEDIILVCAPKRDPVYAIRAGSSGELGSEAVSWISRETRELSSDVPTPAFYDGDFFVLSDVRGALTRVEPQSGKVKWSVELPGRSKFEASPLAADGKIYLINFSGNTVIVDAGDGTILEEIPMGESGDNHIRSSISAAHGQLFIRTNGTLYCVAND